MIGAPISNPSTAFLVKSRHRDNKVTDLLSKRNNQLQTLRKISAHAMATRKIRLGSQKIPYGRS
jgi:hypothetical protein